LDLSFSLESTAIRLLACNSLLVGTFQRPEFGVLGVYSHTDHLTQKRKVVIRYSQLPSHAHDSLDLHPGRKNSTKLMHCIFMDRSFPYPEVQIIWMPGGAGERSG